MRDAFFLLWAGITSAGGANFGSLPSPDLSRKVGWSSASFASRLADLNQLVG